MMKPLLLTLFLLVPVSAQRQKVDPELVELRDEYLIATKNYKHSLEKLLSSYEAAVARAESKLQASQKLRSEGLDRVAGR